MFDKFQNIMKNRLLIGLIGLFFLLVTISNAQTNLVPSSAQIPELKLWIDAEEQSGTDGSAVTMVTDQAGVISGIAVQGTVTLNITASGKKEFSFAGLDNSINLGQPVPLNFVPGTDEFTIMGLMGTGVPSQGALVSKGGSSGVQYHIEVSNDKFWIRVGDNPTLNIFEQSNGLIDQNMHFALVAGLNESKLYINGQLIETKGTSSIGTATHNEDILIGDTATWDWEYSDHIRSVGIFSKPLSTAEIQAIYNDILNPSSVYDSGSVWSQNGSDINFNSGNVGIGITDPGTYKLSVNGDIRAKEVRVEVTNWPDYVFDEDYYLLSLNEIQNYINKEGHLPNIPSAEEIESSGLELGEINRLLLIKIEELTLHIIKQEENHQHILNEIKILKNYFKNTK